MNKKKLVTIRTGQSAGETIGYANKTVTITPEGLSYEITANVKDPALPDKHGTTPPKPELWDQLAESEDLDKLDLIADVPRKPDIYDAGEEWIEFEFEDGTRRVEFSSLEPIAELSETISALRQVRRDIDDDGL